MKATTTITATCSALFAALLLGERLTRPRVLAVRLGVIDTLLILRPGLASD